MRKNKFLNNKTYTCVGFFCNIAAVLNHYFILIFMKKLFLLSLVFLPGYCRYLKAQNETVN
jgi:hypothetical protein